MCSAAIATGDSSTLSGALWASRQGWAVFPLGRGRKTTLRGCDRCSPCLPGSKEKNPAYKCRYGADCPCLASGNEAGAVCHGFFAATTREETIRQWWKRYPGTNFGVHMGASNLLVLDVDSEAHGNPRPDDPAKILPGRQLPDDVDLNTIKDGFDTLALLGEVNGQDTLISRPRTLTVETPSSGLHLWYRVEPGSKWRPSVGTTGLGWCLDIRAGGSYAVMPGSVTNKGRYTAWKSCKTPAPLPQWLAAELRRTGHWPKPPPPRPVGIRPQKFTGGKGYVTTVMTRALTALAGALPGERNTVLCKSAYALGRLVGAGLISEQVAVDALIEAGQSCGIPPGERKAEDTIRRCLERGRRNPATPRTRS
ncbi:bifunctional DNA primase/polymerase [Streptomyces sp. ET3-23]|uniref:bifunctional DNA primase/polymerase n=1 Tax=Streptomyces sp. ET3-23 TaxID=2885643 RepID=UPI001D1095AB|nr:bifunctional DNA primase/polymerase [Streptomyces sp. ET3-23]MCC2280275.1 bifunctional DNA primase/polymerase [Streptomyces sp. ET3-23]